MADLPEWALPIRDEMARAICDHTRELTRYDDLDDYSRKFWLGHATAALTVALPLIAEHMAGVIEAEATLCDCFAREARECACGAWDDDKRMSATEIAATIRQEATPRKP